MMQRASNIILLLAAIAFPLVMQAFEQAYYISFASRIMIYAIAATSLNLILGYGGMISFGHAAFVGAGTYVAGIMIVEGAPSALIGWPLAMLLPGLLALAIGAISLRTRGVYFIMITLAFAQMIYYLTVSMKAYGGEEGLTLPGRSTLPFVDLKDDASFYYAVLALLALTMLLLGRLAASRFGRVIEAIRENETRMEAIGFPTRRYKLACFVIAGAFGGLAGALLANQGSYVNPSILHWTQSGNLMIMVILGGVGFRYGGLIGALTLLGLEEFIANHKIAWMADLYPNYQQHSLLGVGIILLIIVLYAPQGIAGLFTRRRNG
jgi:branched-chain amino acid transport system permease protein